MPCSASFDALDAAEGVAPRFVPASAMIRKSQDRPPRHGVFLIRTLWTVAPEGIATLVQYNRCRHCFGSKRYDFPNGCRSDNAALIASISGPSFGGFASISTLRRA